MPNKAAIPLSGIPEGSEKRVFNHVRVNLLGVVELLLEHLTPVLCQTVFKRYRKTERERRWTLYALALFWVAVLVQKPVSLKLGVHETRKGRGRGKLWPRVNARARAFFEKAAAQRPELFRRLYQNFLESILPQAPAAYASWMERAHLNFPGVYIVDGSRLDSVRHRLKIVWNERAKILPGCVTVFYDLFHGICREILFFPDAARAELPRAQEALCRMPAGSLIVGDRLYCTLQYFHALEARNLFGLFRRNGQLKIKNIQTLSRKQGSRILLEDALVEVGGIVNKYKKIRLRLIRFRGRGRSLDILTSVLDCEKLSAEEAVTLYGLRWSVERLFLDLKETLDMGTIYASHPNLVAQQVYASGMVHAAFRVAQARIAQQARLLPEQISPGKLFPQLARAIRDYCVCLLRDDEIRRLNPGKKIRFPSFKTMPFAYAKLESILLERRKTCRRRLGKLPVGMVRRWKSYAHVNGTQPLLRSASLEGEICARR